MIIIDRPVLMDPVMALALYGIRKYKLQKEVNKSIRKGEFQKAEELMKRMDEMNPLSYIF